jgi:hypothetical protein
MALLPTLRLRAKTSALFRLRTGAAPLPTPLRANAKALHPTSNPPSVVIAALRQTSTPAAKPSAASEGKFFLPNATEGFSISDLILLGAI